MSSWKDRYREASYRGIKFYVESETKGSGRRLVRHVFPGKDNIEYDDLGAAEKTISVSAYIVGKDYDVERDNLELQLMQPGRGRLIIPTMSVDFGARVENYTYTENPTQEGGMVRFSIQFIIESEPVSNILEAKPDPVSQLEATKLSSYQIFKDEFNSAIASATKTVNRVNVVNDLLDTALDGILTAKTIFAPVAKFKEIVDRSRGKLISIALGIDSFVDEFKQCIDFGTSTNEDDTPSESAASASFYELIRSTTVTPSTTELAYDVRLYNNTLALMTCASASTSIQFIPVTSVDNANALRDEFFAIIDSLGDAGISDAEYEALYDIRSATHEYIEYTIANLQNYKTIVLDESQTVLNLTNALYSAVGNEQDIIDRNKIRHPMFVPGGIQLKVLEND